jgi:hypothetical protein
MIAFALCGGSMMVTTPARADGYIGTQVCGTNQICHSTSVTSGTPGSYPYQYTVHEHNSVRSTSFALTSSSATHSYSGQRGTVSVWIYTTGTLWSQTRGCVCNASPCATPAT